jgi:hypothetical protein
MNLDFNPERNNTSEGDDLEQSLIQKMSAYTIHNLKDISSEYFRLFIDCTINKIDPNLKGDLR